MFRKVVSKVAKLTVFTTGVTLANTEANVNAVAETKKKMVPSDFTKLRVKEIRVDSQDTRHYIFDDDTYIPACGYVLVRATINGEVVVRPYTPVDDGTNGLDLLIKSYDNGKISKLFGQLKVGDEVEVKGPMIKYKYEPNSYDQVTFIAGGTGITPALRLIEEISRNPADKTKVVVLSANKNDDHSSIGVRKLVSHGKWTVGAGPIDHPEQFRLIHVLDEAPTTKAQVKEFYNLSAYALDNVLPGPIDHDTLTYVDFPPSTLPRHKVFVCGPPGMMAAISGSKAPDYSQGEVGGLLKELGYTKEQVFKF